MEFLGVFCVFFPLRRQKRSTSITKSMTNPEPKLMPKIVPMLSFFPLLVFDDGVPDPVCVRDGGERVRLLRALPGGGAVYGGGGGAGPLSNEFPSYLFQIKRQNKCI